MAAIVAILSFYGCDNDAGDKVKQPQDTKCLQESDCESGVCLSTGYCAVLANEGESCDNKMICRPGYRCADGICVEMTGPECQDGICNPTSVDGCTENSQCASGVCLEDGSCALLVGEGESCDNTRICKNGYSCVDGKCTDGAAPEGCSVDADCRHRQVCRDGQCVYPFACADQPLPENEDYDNDGIANGLEISTSECLDPCNPDTDGDGVEDGKEDYNHNGIVEPELGETDPCDPNSKHDPNSQEGILLSVCDQELVLSGGSTGHYNRFNLAKTTNKGYKYYPAEDMAETSVVRFENDKVVGLFGSNSAVTGTGAELLGSVLDSSSFFVISAFNAPVPSASWLSEKEGEGYNHDLQTIPDHTVDRQKYSLDTNGKSLQEIADAIAKKLDPQSTAQYAGSIKCSEAATLYLVRSSYEKGSIYGVAIACDSYIHNASVSAQMDDVLSGTLVSPTRDLGSNIPASPYEAYSNFVCQIDNYHQSSGKVDFLWVIDNSSSMADELEKLSKTVQSLGTTMKSYGVDFRVGVTTMDAYLLDEDPTAYRAYDENNDYKIVLDKNSYLNGVGFKQHNDTLKDFRGFLDVLTDGKLNGGKQNAFVNEVTRNSNCTLNGKAGRNICGFGVQDGLRSGAFTLSRIAVNLDDDAAPDYYSNEDKTSWDIIKKIKAGVTEGDAKKLEQVTLNDSENSLLYIVWVTDDESRQFKEEAGIVKPVDSKNINPVFDKSTGAICKTGYKLENGIMRTGVGGADLAVNSCNPSMKAKLDQLVADGIISEDSSMEELEAAYPEYADMLKYYIKQYQNFAQGRKIMGFALVGDAGRQKGGWCKPLAVCSEADCTKKDTDGSCAECKNWDYNNPSATVGANYGLSYIHMARFLSSYYPENPDKAMREGSKGSICATDYNCTVTAMAEDAFSVAGGRVAALALKGYPISSTIRVYRVSNGKVAELTRNETTDGWSYDAAQNAISFRNVNDISDNDSIAVTYVLWKAVE